MVGALGAAHVILTRAGGGQGFGGGGGGGGGGGFGGGGGGGFFFFGGGALARGGSIVAAIIVVALVVLAVMFVSRSRRTPATAGGIVDHPYPHSDGPAYRPGTVPVVESGQPVAEARPAVVNDGLAAIAARDRGFDVE